MFQIKKDLPLKITEEQNIYSIRQKFKGRGDLGIKLKKITSTENKHYKLIQLNFLGQVTGNQKRIKKIIENMEFYKNTDSVPSLIFSDKNRILLEWVHGNEYYKVDKNARDYNYLARFNAKNFIDFKERSVEKIIKKRTEQLNELENLNSLSAKTISTIKDLFSNRQFLGSDYIFESLCFADTSLKNYICRDDDPNNLVYIDVFGLARRETGRVYTKQLSRIPKKFRKDYAEEFKKALSVDISATIAFSYLLYLISRIYSNTKKRSLRDYKTRDKKVKKAIIELHSVIDVVKSGNSIEDWLIHKIR